jgi:hypothetical protein
MPKIQTGYYNCHLLLHLKKPSSLPQIIFWFLLSCLDELVIIFLNNLIGLIFVICMLCVWCDVGIEHVNIT